MNEILLPSANWLSKRAIQSKAALFVLNSTSASPNERPSRFLKTSQRKILPNSSKANCCKCSLYEKQTETLFSLFSLPYL